MSTTSRFEEIADTYILQVSAVSSPKLLTDADDRATTHITPGDSSDSDNPDSKPDIFKVFVAKKKCYRP